MCIQRFIMIGWSNNFGYTSKIENRCKKSRLRKKRIIIMYDNI